jgi:hypothetical protein
MTEEAAARPGWLRPKTRAELGEGEAHGGFGKWSQPGVPHKGWVCAEIDDVEDTMEVCEMCETAEVRYVHVMTNPRWEGELRVGCVCAGRMEDDAAAAERREAEFKRTQQPKVKAALSWVKAADEILGAAGLSYPERDFVKSIRERMAWSARPRARKRYDLSGKQVMWFRSIYLRVVQQRKTG